MTEVARCPSSTNAESRSATPKRPRKYLKCKRCRDDRKACEFNSGSPTCVRCIGLGHDCGGPCRAERMLKRKAGAFIESTSLPTGGDIDARDTSTETMSVLNRVAPKRRANHGHMSYGVAVNAMAQRLYARMKSDLENSMTFEDASDMLSIYRKSQSLLNHIIRQIESLQDHLMSGNSGSHPQHSRIYSDVEEMASGIVDPVSGEYTVVLCIANIPKRYQPTGATARAYAHNTNRELPTGYYVHAARVINQLIRTIPQDLSEEWVAYNQQLKLARKHDFFPAWAIAWLNLDFENAQRLWSETVGKEGLVIDVLGRTFPHLVTESGDPRPMDQINKKFFADAGRDGRDLNLMDLAVIGDSASMVTNIIDDNLVPPPHTRAMQRAIRGKRLSLARDHLLNNLFETDEIELKMLANLAYHNGLIELSDELKEMKPYQATQEDTLTALDDPAASFSARYDLHYNTSPHTLYPDRYWQPPLGSFDSWDDIDFDDETQISTSRDEGGGLYSHCYDDPFSPS